ncbi:MAG: bifunctional uroporphyrinogen-III C-methylase/synthase, partial [Lachnospiraceae bacterium]|nr:bifunctional uroporphyrinogen-III C-methylase/synthase [Lachnospiraceae bacterium]
LLTYTLADCEQIYVGKEPGMHNRKQDDINEILVECSEKYERVVRLKGGDPFVFGRGGEEIEALIKAGIDYEVIPGITSAIAVPECAGIPVTHRETARSFHVITGHTKVSNNSSDYLYEPVCEKIHDNKTVNAIADETLTGIDFNNLAHQEGTLVFLMGLSNLKAIADNLIANGKQESTPVAVISDGTTIYEKQVRGTLIDIADKVKESKLGSPAVIVIGETAEKDYRCYTRKTTDSSKIRVGVTATPSLYQRLRSTFYKAGIPVASVCEMEVVPDQSMMDDLGEIIRGDKKGEELTTYTWIIFTSQNGVRLFFERFRRENGDYRILSTVKFAVLGSGTKNTLMQYGFHADFVPSRYTIHAFCEEFSEMLTDKDKVLIPRARQGSKELYDYQDRWPGESTILSIYDVKGCATRHMQRIDELTHLIFASASGVAAFMQELNKSGQKLPDNIKTVCIGEITAGKLSEYGRSADVVASIQDTEGLLKVIL